MKLSGCDVSGQLRSALESPVLRRAPLWATVTSNFQGSRESGPLQGLFCSPLPLRPLPPQPPARWALPRTRAHVARRLADLVGSCCSSLRPTPRRATPARPYGANAVRAGREGRAGAARGASRAGAECVGLKKTFSVSLAEWGQVL